MSINLGLYDLLANLIPGSIYLLIIYLGATRFTSLSVDLAKMTLWHFLILGGAAYVIGLILDPIANKLWFQKLGKRKSQIEMVSGLNASNDSIEFSEERISWGALKNYIKHVSPDISRDIQRMSALNILLRNVSFALFFCYY